MLFLLTIMELCSTDTSGKKMCMCLKPTLTLAIMFNVLIFSIITGVNVSVFLVSVLHSFRELIEIS